MRHFFLVAVAMLFTAPAYADDAAKVREAMAQLAPGAEISSIKPSVVDGFYEVLIDMQVVYVSSDGKYLMQGRLIDIKAGIDLSEPTIAAAKAGIINKIEDKDTIIFAPENYQDTITVFTDIDCPYCVKFHREMDQYMAAGIRVRYLFFPRAGIGSGSHKKALAVWCADDQQAAMTLSKAGKPVSDKRCDNPIDSHMSLVSKLGVRGTPAVYTETGDQLGGYLPAAQVAARLKALK
ncbi:MAG: DsbC family protein [Candidatus Polarisedimenticolaceae bacterium]|nr:DsbC family protein [Candidatus Polarisedimenticolaceae bacterium]